MVREVLKFLGNLFVVENTLPTPICKLLEVDRDTNGMLGDYNKRKYTSGRIPFPTKIVYHKPHEL